MRIIQNISILLAGVILLLHTVLPHEHHSELNEADHIAEHESAKGLLDFIKLAFHMDQGEGHLEKYQVSGTIFFFQAVLAEELVIAFQPIAIAENSYPSTSYKESFCTRLLSSHLRFRGPPHQA